MKGFVEGTVHVTTGDKIKEGDSRRSKSKCKNYFKGICQFANKKSKDFPTIYTATGELKCIGSAHCKYYNEEIKNDGISKVRIFKSNNEIASAQTEERNIRIVKIIKNEEIFYFQEIAEDNNSVILTKDYRQAKKTPQSTLKLIKKLIGEKTKIILM